MTATDTTLTAEQIAFAAQLEARRIARETAPTPQQKAAATRAKKAAAQLALAMAQYERDVAANPNGIIYNPSTKDFDLYRAGAWCGSYGTQLQAERAQLELVARELERTAGDLVVTQIVETPAGDVAVSEVIMAEMSETAPRLVTSPLVVFGESFPIDRTGSHQDFAPTTDSEWAMAIRQPSAPAAEALLVRAWRAAEAQYGAESIGAADVYAVLENFRRHQGWAICGDDSLIPNGGCVLVGEALACPMCARQYPDGILSADEMARHPHAVPLALPVCAMPGCGRQCAQHGAAWCGCIPEVAPVGRVLSAAEIEMLTACDEDGPIFPPHAPVDPTPPARPGVDCWTCVAFPSFEGSCAGCPLPFTPDPDETRAELARIEADAGVVEAEAAPSELQQRIAGCELALVKWADALVDGRDFEAARMVAIRAMLDTEQHRRLELAMDRAA